MSGQDRYSRSQDTEGRLAWLIVHRRDALLARWVQRVLEDPTVPHANRLSAPALEDHIPALLQRLLERLESHPAAARVEWGERVGREVGGSAVGVAHAEQRFSAHYTLPEALRELSLFRVSVLEMCTEQGVALRPDEAALLHTTVDEMMATSASALERASRLAYEQTMGVVAHDLRNPINVIGMFASRLQTGKVDDPRKAGEALTRSVRMMSRLVEDLLMYSTLEAGHLSLHAEGVDAREILHETYDHYRSLAERRSVALSVTEPDGAVQVRCDRDRILQALGNVVGNAIKFTPKGGSVRVAIEALAKGCLFRVRDTGPGIPVDQREDIFRPFWQAPGTPSGAGLGLAIARGIVEAHGGAIALEESAEPGTTFTLTLAYDGAPDASVSLVQQTRTDVEGGRENL